MSKEIIIINDEVQFRGIFSEEDWDKIFSCLKGLDVFDIASDLRTPKPKQQADRNRAELLAWAIEREERHTKESGESQTALQILEEFYKSVSQAMSLFDLSLVSEVSRAFDECEKKLKNAPDEKYSEFLDIFYTLYMDVANIFHVSNGFLESAPLLRGAVEVCVARLHEYYEGTPAADEGETHRHPVYEWCPQPNITDYELALCIPVLTGYSMHNAGEEYYIEAVLPAYASRHFKRQA
jgi:hypothetical protein